MLGKFDKSTNPFKVPENYFENLNKTIMEQLPAKESEKAKIVPLWKRFVPWTTIAAALIGVVFYIGFTLDKANNATGHNPQSNTYAASSLTEDEMFDYMEEEVIASAYNDMLYNSVHK